MSSGGDYRAWYGLGQTYEVNTVYYDTSFHHAKIHWTMQRFAMLFCSALYRTILLCTMPYYTGAHYSAQFHTPTLFPKYIISLHTVLPARHCTPLQQPYILHSILLSDPPSPSPSSIRPSFSLSEACHQ